MNKDIHTKKQLQIEKRLAKAKLSFDLSYWVKWTGSFILLGAMMLRGAQVYPIADLIMSTIGCICWLWVGIMWKDRALIILNAVGLSLLFKNILTYIL